MPYGVLFSFIKAKDVGALYRYEHCRQCKREHSEDQDLGSSRSQILPVNA